MANHPPIDVDSKVGLGPAKLCVNGKELAELSNPAFLCQNAPCKTSKLRYEFGGSNPALIQQHQLKEQPTPR